MLIKLHSFVANPDYDAANGLLLKNQQKKLECMINVREFLWVFPTLNSSQGHAVIKFRNGEMLTFEETVDEINAAIEAASTPKKK